MALFLLGNIDHLEAIFVHNKGLWDEVSGLQPIDIGKIPFNVG